MCRKSFTQKATKHQCTVYTGPFQHKQSYGFFFHRVVSTGQSNNLKCRACLSWNGLVYTDPPTKLWSYAGGPLTFIVFCKTKGNLLWPINNSKGNNNHVVFGTKIFNKIV